MIVATRHEYGSQEAQSFVHRLRDRLIPGARFPAGVQVKAGGAPPQGVDFLSRAYGVFPWLVVAVLALTYVLLMRAFRSLLLPLKAVLLNLLSVGASYGALVVLFRFGVGSDVLGLYQFPQIEGWIPIFLFAMLFGLSMDYEVFLVSRMREAWDETHDNGRAVAIGLERTGRIVTAAAVIMVAAFSGFMAGSIVGLQEFGAGLAVAIFLDATRRSRAPRAFDDGDHGPLQLVAAAANRQVRPCPPLAAPGSLSPSVVEVPAWPRLPVLILPDGSERPLAPEFTIGRADDNDLRSRGRRSAATTRSSPPRATAGSWRTAAASTGRFVNGARIQPGAKVPLRHGDRIGLGAESVVFSAPESLVDPEVTTALQTGPPALTRPLSPFQRQVVEALCSAWLAGGSLDDLPTNEEIAARLGTPGATETVKAALRRAYAKAGLTEGSPYAKRRALCKIARQRGWI